MTDTSTSHSLAGWSIAAPFDDIEWQPWGSGDGARAKVLGDADGYFVCLIEMEAGYTGDAHTHDHAEFSYVIKGTVRNQGVTMEAGRGYAAAAGSEHTDFESLTEATCLTIFKL